jgi:peptidoglycan/LPS O-acetylase OafA/YrhL
MDVVLLGSTLVIAELSWRVVERRFLARRPLRQATPPIEAKPMLVRT